MARKSTPATAAEVRSFLVEQNLIPATQRQGRLNPEHIAVFNAGRPKGSQYVVGQAVPKTVEVKVTREVNGRKRSRTVEVDPKAARAFALAQGLTTATRGVLPASAVEAYALSTLG